MSPQTMAVITRTFPAHQRGRAMSLWGAVAGVAVLVGPIAGGLLVDSSGWQWIFIVNVPVGVVGFVLAVRLVPALSTAVHRFDLIGVGLSAIGMFLLVFGLQEGQAFAWGPAAWGLIIGGVVVLGLFVAWQTRAPEPLIPLGLFRDRNFLLANIAVTTLGLAVTAQAFPDHALRAGGARVEPDRVALLLAPSAVISTFLAPYVGHLTDRAHPRWIAAFGLSCFAASLLWLAAVMRPETPIWQSPADRVDGDREWLHVGPDSLAATRNLPMDRAGCGCGRLQHTTRQVGAVLGSAGIAALMQARLSAVLPGAARLGQPGGRRGDAAGRCTRRSRRRWRSPCCCPPGCC